MQLVLVSLPNRVPRQLCESAQQPAVMSEIDAQPLGNRPHELAVGNWEADAAGQLIAQEECSLLVATCAQTALAAGERHEHFVPAAGGAATHSRESIMQVATAKELADGLAEDWTPDTEVLLVAVRVHPFEVREISFEKAKEGRLAGPALAIDGVC